MVGGLIFRSMIGVGGGERIGAGLFEIKEAGGADVPGAVGAGGVVEDPLDGGANGGWGEFGVGGHFLGAAPDTGGTVSDPADQGVGGGGGGRIAFGDLEEGRAEGFRIELVAVKTVVGGHDVEGWGSGGDGGARGFDRTRGFGGGEGGAGQFEDHLLCVDLIISGIAVFGIGYLYLVGDRGVCGEVGVRRRRLDLHGWRMIGLLRADDQCEEGEDPNSHML